MKCTHLPGGIIICGRRDRSQTCKAHGAKATKLCDWKTGNGKTCDEPLCNVCTFSPEPGKDICPHHKAMWDKHPKNPVNK